MRVSLLLVTLGFATQALAQTSKGDNFNRPNSLDLGPDWRVEADGFEIFSNRACGRLGKTSVARFKRIEGDPFDARCSIDFLPEKGGDKLPIYVGVAAGVGIDSRTQGIFARVQDSNQDGLYDEAYILRGSDGFPWGSSTGHRFVLNTPTSKGRITLWFSDAGDIANLDLDRDFDGVPEQTFSVGNVLSIASQLGRDFGIVTFNQACADNFYAETKISSRFEVRDLVAGSRATFRVGGLPSDVPVLFLYSLSGPGPTMTKGLSLDMMPPILLIGKTRATAQGEALLFRRIPGQVSGRPIWMQAVGLLGGGKRVARNSLAMTIG